MARVYIGGDKWADIREPTRGEFPANLGGAVTYSLTMFLYKIAEIAGGVIGAVLGGALVQFMERIEPGLVTYTRPLLDMLLGLPNLPSELRRFFEQLRSPTHEAAAGILTGLASTGGSAVVGSVLNSLLAPVTFGLNKQIRPARASPSEMLAMAWRGKLATTTLLDHFRDIGYPDELIGGYTEVARPRPDPGTLVELLRRGKTSRDSVLSELTMLGFTLADANKLLSLQYRYLDAVDILQAQLRGLKTRDVAISDLSGLGYSSTDVNALLEMAHIIPGPNDLIRFAVREAYSESVVAKFGYDDEFPSDIVPVAAKVGLDADWVKRYWRAHWDLPSPQMGYEMLHRGLIDQGTLETLLRTADYPRFWRAGMIGISYNPLTRVDVRRMYGLGVLDRAAVKRCYKDIGYSDANAELLTEFTVRYEEGDTGDKAHKRREATVAVILSAYKKGILDRSTTTTRLLHLGFEIEDVNLEIAITDAEQAVKIVPDYVSEYRRDIKTILENAYIKGVISRAEVSRYLSTLGLGDTEIQYALSTDELHKTEKDLADRVAIVQTQYVNRSIDRTKAVEALGRLGLPSTQTAQLFTEWDVARELRTRRLTLEQYAKAFEFGYIAEAAFRDTMKGLGYADTDIELYTKMKKEEANIV